MNKYFWLIVIVLVVLLAGSYTGYAIYGRVSNRLKEEAAALQTQRDAMLADIATNKETLDKLQSNISAFKGKMNDLIAKEKQLDAKLKAINEAYVKLESQRRQIVAQAATDVPTEKLNSSVRELIYRAKQAR